MVIGADVDALDLFARDVELAVVRLDRARAVLDTQLRSSFWSGAQASAFRGEWASVHLPALVSVGVLLRDGASQIRDHSDEQRAASKQGGDSAPTARAATPVDHSSSTPPRQVSLRHVSPYQVSPCQVSPCQVSPRHVSPYQVRFAANRAWIAHELDNARVARAKWLGVPLLGVALGALTQLRGDPLDGLDRRIAMLESLGGSERDFLFVDLSGDGRAAEVFGDLDRAAHVALVVPGVSSELTGFGGSGPSPAEALRGEDPEVATIQWLGYDPPDDLLRAASNGALSAYTSAALGARALQQFVASLRGRGASDITVVGHSLGAYLVSIAATADGGLAADRVVLAGSPGSLGSHASDYRLNGARGSSSSVFTIEQGVDVVSTSLFGRSALGADVYSERFGASRLADGQPGSGNLLRNHGAYFSDATSLRSQRWVIAGARGAPA